MTIYRPHMTGEPLTASTFPDVHLILTPDGPDYRLKFGETDVTQRFPRPAHHSPNGVAWGYQGSGPADLALLVLHLHLPPGVDLTYSDVLRTNGFPPDQEKHDEYEARLLREDRLDVVWDRVELARQELPILTYSGQYVSRDAWSLHQTYKAEVIADLDSHTAHVLRAEAVQQWLIEHAATEIHTRS